MARLLVAGMTCLEVTYQLDGFPLQYDPVRYPFFAIDSSVSGVGYNVARALTALGDDVRYLSLIGADAAGRLVEDSLARHGLRADGVLPALARTPHSLILYDGLGRRQIHVDLKDLQERAYPEASFDAALAECALAVLCNANFCRPFLERAKRAGKPVATDVHAVSQLEDAYNHDFMRAADVLFLSDELLPEPAEDWVRRLRRRYDNEVIVVGLGARGALLSERGRGAVEHVPAFQGVPVVSTVGAGDALFSCFVHDYARGADATTALRRAVVFAACKLGAASGASGFLTEAQLDERLAREP